MSELDIFVAAIAIQDAAERAAYLDDACANQPELRARLDDLLAAHTQVSSPIDHPPAEASAFAQTASVASFQSLETSAEGRSSGRREELGTVLGGRYKLIELIGEGGMGSVYLAEQSEPVKRQVALKLIKSGMDTKRVLARFDAERQALALMDHPNIARVFDGGTTDRGQPFFVMELVRGNTITKYCDRQRLSVKARLELFVLVCQAVQHAHQKGIIHRDLKPGNILVTDVDGRATPKVIDFGVAKATEQSLTNQSVGETGAIVGTPAYMSPEQADPSSMDIDTRTDVYALGIVLYELLTGSPPIDIKQFKKAAFLEMLRIVREVDPPRPSTKISTADALPNIAANRDIDPSRLSRLLKGELDWVVMKAIEKDRTRRYESANGLARDIQRYLLDEVVEARPPSAGYRLKKFVRRNKGRVLAASLVVLALIGGMIGTSIGLVRADAQRIRAQDAEATAVEERNKAITSADAEKAAKLVAIEEGKKAEKARETTAQQRQLALNTVRDVLLRVDELMKNDVKLVALRLEIIRRMLDDVDQIRDHSIKNPLEDRTEALAYSRLGDVYAKTSRIQDAVEWLTKSHRVLKQMSDENPNDVNALRNLAAICTSLADAVWRIGQGPYARTLHADALRLRQKRLSLLPQNADEMEVTSTNMDIAESFNNVAYADLRLGDPVAAIRNYLAADTTFQALPAPASQFLNVQRQRAEIQVRLADARSRLGDLVTAEKLYREALSQRESLQQRTIRPFKNSELIKTDVGQSRMYLGDFYLMQHKDRVRAFAEYEICLRIHLESIQVEPDSLDLRQRLGATYYRMGVCAGEMPALSAIASAWGTGGLQNHYYQESLKYREELAKLDRMDATNQVEYLLVLARLGKYGEVEDLANRLLNQAGNDPQTLFQLVCAYAICSQGTDAVSNRCRESAFKIMERLRRSGWKDPAGLLTDPDTVFLLEDPKFKKMLADWKNVEGAKK